MRHGGHATPTVDEIATVEQELRELAAAAPLRDSNGDLPVFDRPWARELAAGIWRLRRVRAWVDLHGALDEKSGSVQPAAALELRLSQHVREGLKALGMTPRSRAKLGIQISRLSGTVCGDPSLSELSDDALLQLAEALRERRRQVPRDAGE